MFTNDTFTECGVDWGIEFGAVRSICSLFGGSYFHERRAGPEEKIRGRRANDLVGLDLAENGENHIRLIIIGTEGWLYVNDRRAGIIPFNLGTVPNPDRINLVIADIAGGRFEYESGGKTRFEEFTVWKWHPSLFDLPKDDD